jgi:isopentenyl diphosphate isomerase/L-lactate dehydrogenase-like FMN-dependent dehydrogenase
MAQQSTPRLDWDLMQSIRDAWDRPLFLKGVLHPADAVRARDMAIDGIVISNHGGRQLDAAVSPIEAIVPIRAYVGADFPIIIDGGIGSGEDILRAFCLGANFVLLGRPFLYAVAALGKKLGPRYLIEMLKDELDRAMGQVGAATLDDLDTSLIAR